MSLSKSYFINGRNIILTESQQLFVVRTRNGIHPSLILRNCLDINESELLREIDEFPEAQVWVYRLSKDSTFTIKTLKETIRQKPNSDLLFIGSVYTDPDSQRYQIYTGNLFIKFSSHLTKEKCRQLLRKFNLKEKLDLGFTQNSFFIEPIQFENVQSSNYKDAFEWAAQLSGLKEVISCQPELVVKRKSLRFNKQPYRNDPDRNWIAEKIDLHKAWNHSKGKGVKICIIDDGIDPEHPAFGNAKIISSRDMLKPNNPFAAHQFESELHGTACASVAASSDSRALGIAPEAELIIIRCKGLGSVLEAEAIYWAVESGADIISCSWGPSDGDIDNPDDDFPSHRLPEHTKLALEYAATKGRNGKGCAIFFAAGNGNEAVSLDSYASCEYVMAIGSVNKEDQLTVYSDKGFPMFCVFPSSDLIKENGRYRAQYGLTVADRTGVSGFTSDDYFSLFGGTSASAPGIAGVAALALSIAPEMNLNDLKKQLQNSCIKIGTIEDYDSNNYSQKYGYGLISAELLMLNILKPKKMESNKSPRGFALHIGVDQIDLNVYSDFSPLNGCVNDAKALQSITKKENFETNILLTDSDATRENILKNIQMFAKDSKAGDLVVISYAGHGSFINDESGDELISGDNPKDEVLVTYNGFLIDDEIFNAIQQFKNGVRVVWIGDSCHSKSQTRGVPVLRPESNYRLLDHYIVQNHYRSHQAKYDNIRKGLKRSNSHDAKAAVWNMFACQEDELAEEFNGRGLFTLELEKLYHSGNILTIDEANSSLSKPLTNSQNPAVEFFGLNRELFDTGIFKIGNPQPSSFSSSIENQTISSETRLLVSSKKSKLAISTGHRGKSKKIVRVHNNEYKSSDQNLSPWDQAYKFYKQLDNKSEVEFVEPDSVSAIYKVIDKNLESMRSGNSYLSSYPNPEHIKYQNLKNPFIWHLGDEYSQLRKAFNEIRRGFKNELPSEEERKELPLICHIDTGILDDHPSEPLFLDFEKSRSFGKIGSNSDPTDIVKDKGIENQGHGQGTISILAGGYVELEETNNQFKGYYGAFPFARVMTLKISENVVLFSGKKFERAVRYAVDQGADVISMSMAGIATRSMMKAVNYAYENGVVLVTAAGNSWVKSGKKLLPKGTMYPARFKRVIGVTGATLDYTPYLVKENKDWERITRDTGGICMQTCYGPKRVNDSNIAAYTPNVEWAGEESNGSYFDKSGGGTSSATPQVAAAAAMWIYKHRKELNRLTKNQDQWKRVEYVRKALFTSAEPSSHANHAQFYNEVFGNGMLKTFDALQKTPSDLGEIKRTTKDKIGWSSLDNLILQFAFRGKKSTVVEEENTLKKMLALELTQLTMTDPLFFDFDENNSLSDMAEAIMNSSQSSEFLKKITLRNSEVKSRNDSTRNQNDGAEFNLSKTIQTENKGEYKLIAEGCAFQLNKQRNTEEDILAEYEIEIIPSINRGVTKPGLIFLASDKANPALLMTELEDGLKQYEWILPEKRESRGIGYFEETEASFLLNIPSSVERSRGKIKRFFIKIFRTIKNEALSDRPGLISGIFNGSEVEWTSQSLVPKQEVKAQKKTLLLLHGTFSSAESSFSDLLVNEGFFKKLDQMGYGRHILAYNMSTIRAGIAANSRDLIKLLKTFGINSTSQKIGIVASSRGCLVARYAFSNNVKMALIAGTHLGTPLASDEHLSKMINRISNLAAFTFSATGFTFFLRGLSSVVKFIWKAKGLADQEEGSKLVYELMKKGLSEKQLVIGSNLEPDEKLLRQLGNDLIDRLVFSNRPNDGVTLTDSSLVNVDGNPHSPNHRIPDGSVNHFSFFNNEEVINQIIKHL